MMSWHDDSDAEERDEQAPRSGAGSGGEDGFELLSDAEYERLEAEIDGAVESDAQRTFAGTMVVDADDVKWQQEVKASNQQQADANKSKKKKNVIQKEVAETESVPPPAISATPTAKKPKVKKSRVSVMVTETQSIEVVEVVDEVGVLENGATVEILVTTKPKKTKTKIKEKKNGETEPGEVDGGVMGAQEVPQLMEDTTGALQAPKKEKKKREQAKKQRTKENGEQDSASAKEPSAPKKPFSTKMPVKSVKKGKSASAETLCAGSELSSKAKPNSHSSTPSTGDTKPRRENYYEDYSDRAAVSEALARGELHQGKLRVNPTSKYRAYLTVDGILVDIMIDNIKDRNRAMDGDLVAIQILPEHKWMPNKEPTIKGDEKQEASNGLKVEIAGPVPSVPVSSPEPTSSKKETFHALWRPNLDVSRCLMPSDPTKPLRASPLNAAQGIYQRSLELQARPTAKVVCILAPGTAEGFVGSLEPKTKMLDANAPLPPDEDFACFNADDQRLPRRIQIPRLQLPDEFVAHPLKYAKEMLCFCRISKWSASHEAPLGQFVKTLGEYAGIESGISAILMKHGLVQHTNDFSSLILDALDANYGVGGDNWRIPAAEVAVRRDFRDYQIFSIDPYNARDLDDALHICALDANESVFEVGVHIADVTHFVSPGSALDMEAQQRATSVYLVNKVLPMLPRVLCERLCSLQPQVDRLAFSVVWQMHRDGTLVDGCVPWFGKSIIRSCCKLDYGTAQKMLDGDVTSASLDEWEVARRPVAGDNASITPASVIQAVKYLWTVAKHRREARFATGAVALQNIKLTFQLDAKGNPTSFGTYQLKNSNRLVEEYMLLANYLVAQRLLQAQGPLAFIRRHPEPNEQALATALSMLSEHSITVEGDSPKKLTDSLEAVRVGKGEMVYSVVQNLITKPMKPAEYLVAGHGGNEDAWRHYALHIPYYTHFTSPIRRYADVVVHRLLQESLVDADAVATRVDARKEELIGMMQVLQSVAQNCNEKKMTSKNAEKECDQVFLCAYVKHHGALDVTGVVISAGQHSFTVYVVELGIEQRVEVRSALGPGVRSMYNEKTATLSLVFNARKKRPNKGKSKREALAKEREAPRGVQEQAEEEMKEGDESVAELKTSKDLAAAPPQTVAMRFLTPLKMKMMTTDRMPLALKFEVVAPHGCE